jgi:hypothetical protein
MCNSTPPRPSESRGTPHLFCDRCGKALSAAESIHVVEADIPACPEFPHGFHSAFDLCEECFDRCELDATRYEVPNIYIPGEGWRVL